MLLKFLPLPQLKLFLLWPLFPWGENRVWFRFVLASIAMWAWSLEISTVLLSDCSSAVSNTCISLKLVASFRVHGVRISLLSIWAPTAPRRYLVSLIFCKKEFTESVDSFLILCNSIFRLRIFDREDEVYHFSKMDHTPWAMVCPTTRDKAIGKRVELIKVNRPWSRESHCWYNEFSWRVPSLSCKYSGGHCWVPSTKQST